MANMRRRPRAGGTRAKAWTLAISVFLLFIVSVVVAFPRVWNRWSFLPDVNIPEFRLGLDLQGGAHLVYEANMTQIPEADRGTALEGVRDVIERRVNAFGVSEPLVQTNIADGHYRIVIELAGVLDVREAIKQIGETPILEFKEANPDYTDALTDEQKQKLTDANTKEKSAAEDVLKKAQAGDSFEDLVNQYTFADQEKASHGDIVGVTGTGIYQTAVTDIESKNSADGSVLPSVYETPNGYEVLKLIDRDRTKNELELSHILICYTGKSGCTVERDPLTAQDLVNEVLAQVTPENFADLAKQYSEDPGSKDQGGDLGFVKPGATVAAFDAAAEALLTGEITKTAIETDFGYHIIYRRGERPYTAYHLERILMHKTTEAEIAPNAEWKNTDLSGKQLKGATVQFDQNTNAPLIALKFDSDGATLFEQLTERNVGKQIAIFLDDQIISAPTVQQKITGGEAVITGTFALDEAKLLAQRLNAGALPVPVELVSQQTVGPTLGAESLQKSIDAALIGFVLVALFMMLFYRLPGFISVVALLGYGAINLMLYKVFGVTMSLAGIAGFILSVGMAVDANVLIFERLKEELRSGRDLPTAIHEGFARAWPSIRDGHVTVLISSGILFWFSASFIKGFALTLAVGTLVSLFSAITVTRSYMRVVEAWKWTRNNIWLFGVKQKGQE